MKKLLKLPLLILALVMVFCTCAVIVLADGSSTEDVTLTITPDGEEPTVETGLTYSAALSKLLSAKPEKKTEYKIDCLTNVSMTEAAIIDGNTNKTVVVNLNGHTLTVAKSGIIPFNITGSVQVVVNGGDSSRGSIISRNPSGHFVYQKNLTGNGDVSFTMSNVNLTYTNQSTYYCGDGGIWPNPSLFHIQVGKVTVSDCDISFTGEDAKGGVGSLLSLENMSINIFQFSGNSQLTATNVKVDGTNSKGITTYAVSATGNAKATLTGCKLNAVTAVTRGASSVGFVDMTNCEISASSTVFDGAGSILVKNSKVTTGAAALTSSSTTTSLKFFEGTSFDKKPTGTYSCETGYGIYRSGDTYNVVSNGGIYFSSLFSDGMVFQRNEPIHVFGYCDTDGVTVTAKLGDQTKSTSSLNGKWEIVFDALSATKGLSLEVSAQGSEYPIVFEDIDIGEVWLLAGQSNMRHEVKYLEDSAEYIANADNYDNIRFYYQAKSWSWKEEKDTTNGYWGKADSTNIQNLSGIGYVMATKLAAEMEDITVAIVDTSYEGSAIQAWLPSGTVKDISEADYNKYLEHKTYYEANGSMKDNQRAYALAETCHNRMIAPIAGYVVKGVIWYQGESNSGSPDTYRSYYSALTSFWRDLFNNDKLPFVVMQLAPNAANWTNFRAMQYDIVKSDAYSYLISTAFDGPIFNYLDNSRSGNSNHVHPSRKSEIGLRTGDLILGEIYDLTETGFAYAAPTIISVDFNGNTVTLTFDTDLKILYGDTVTGFELGKNGSYVAASGTISGNVLTLTASGTDFDEVRYQYNQLIIERTDGTLMYVTKSYKDATFEDGSRDNYHAVITDKDGNTYTFTSGTDEPVRSTLGGNLSNSTGYPLPSFSIKKS